MKNMDLFVLLYDTCAIHKTFRERPMRGPDTMKWFHSA